MSVTNEDNKVSYVAAGGSSYAIPFYFTDDAHIKLYVNDTIKVLNTDYTVTGEGVASGGTLTLVGTPYSASEILTIIRDIPLTQEDTLTEGGPNSAKAHERRYDKLTMITQQIDEKIVRAVKMPISSTLDAQLTGTVVPDAMLVVDSAGAALKMGPSYLTYSVSLDTKVAAAQTAQTAAELAETNAETAAANALVYEGNASSFATQAANHAATAGTHKDAAAASASAAALAADSMGWHDVIFVSSGDSPLTIDDTYAGVMLSCDCSGGPIVINLPAISVLSLAYPWFVGIKKSDSSGNSVTINANGTDTIDAAASMTIGTSGNGATLIPDVDSTPDKWTSAQFGAAAGNMSRDAFIGDGVATVLSLSVDPGSINNTQLFIGGVYQEKDTYSLSGTSITLDAPVPSGADAEVICGTTLAIGTPSDASVTEAKLAASAVTEPKIGFSGCPIQFAYAETTATGLCDALAIPVDDTIPQITEGGEVLTCSITPKRSTSKLLIEAEVFASEPSNVADFISGALFRDSTPDAIATDIVAPGTTAASGVFPGAALTTGRLKMTVLVNATSTAATTFKMRIGANTAAQMRWNGGGTSRVHGGAMRSFIKITEISQ